MRMNKAKRQNKADAAMKKSQVEVDHQKRRGEIASGALQVTYSGALGSKKVEELREITWGLGFEGRRQ
jgi:DNA-binding protein YbaB